MPLISRASPTGGTYEQYEAEAAAALTPGHLAEQTAGGVAPHGTDGGHAEPYFVREHQETGMDIDDDIPAGSNAKYIRAAPGMGVRALIAPDEDLAGDGEPLVSNGDGTLRESATDTNGNYTEEDVAVAYAAYEAGGAVGEVDRVEVKVA